MAFKRSGVQFSSAPPKRKSGFAKRGPFFRFRGRQAGGQENRPLFLCPPPMGDKWPEPAKVCVRAQLIHAALLFYQEVFLLVKMPGLC